MATAPKPISLDEYMQTSYSPDCEYIDGTVVERNARQRRHAYTHEQLEETESEDPPAEVLDGRINSQTLGIGLNLADLLP